MASPPRSRRLPRPHRPRRGAGRLAAPRVGVLGDLALDVVIRPSRSPEQGTDVAGRVAFAQGGSAATTARWLGRLGARSTMICAVGRDPAGRALVKAVEADHVTVRAVRVAGASTARIAVLVNPDGERTFVTQRGAADLLRPADLKSSWFDGISVLHLPAYSLLGSPLGDAAARAIELARAEKAAVSIDLASIAPLLSKGRAAARELIASTHADVLFATAAEADALQPGHRAEDLLEFAAIAVVKRGSKGATVLARSGGERLRFEVATAPLKAEDTTGAGDAFDAGFLVGWLSARAAGRSLPAALHQAAVAGHKAAARHLSQPRPEIALG